MSASNVVFVSCYLGGGNSADCQLGQDRVTFRSAEGDGALQWSPFEQPAVERLCVCPVCAGTGEQNCFNCLGSGSVQPNGL